MDVLALPPPLSRLMQTACASLGRHPLLMDADSPANFRRGSLQAGNEIRAAAHHLLSFGCSASSGLCPPHIILSSLSSTSSSSLSCSFSSLCSFSSFFSSSSVLLFHLHQSLRPDQFPRALQTSVHLLGFTYLSLSIVITVTFIHPSLAARAAGVWHHGAPTVGCSVETL